MKKRLISITVIALLLAVISQAKDYTIVIQGKQKPTVGTSVLPGEGFSSDTLSVIPGHEVDSIYITLKDAQDNILYYNCVPAAINDHFTIISPTLHQGLFLEIRDDQGFFYWEFDD